MGEIMIINTSGLLYGVGIRDIPSNGDNRPAYLRWKAMIARCYSEAVHENRPSYKGCDISAGWTYFSNFKKWYDENYIEGYHLDKDILKKGNKIYCPQYCRFVPGYINTLMAQKKSPVTGFPGVHFCGKTKKFRSTVIMYDKKVHIGYFETAIDAFEAYKTEKESIIKEVAIKAYRAGEIDKDIFTSMIQYEVER